MQIQFATQTYRHQFPSVSGQRLVNMFAEVEPQGSKSQVAVLSCPGMVLWQNVGAGPIRGMHILNGVLYVVSGVFLYSVTTSKVVTQVGGQISGAAPVSMADNGTQLCIVNGVNGYIYTTISGFQLISSVSFFPANTVTFFDNFFVFNRAGTNQMFVSNVLDGTSYNALAFASATVQPTQIVSILNQQENLFVFTQKDIETWYDGGLFPFPFARYDGATIERGCAATQTTVKEDNSVFFLGDDIIFYRLNGIIPIRISTHAIESVWQAYNMVSDAFVFTYTWQGHKFVVLTFPSAPATWVYDIATNLWHERESWRFGNINLQRWRGNGYIKFNDLDLIGDAYNGNIFQLTGTTFTESGNMMRGLMVAPTIHSDRKRVFHTCLELDMEAGVGLDTDIEIASTTTGNPLFGGLNPQVRLDWSNDRGHTFTSLRPWQSLGKIGDYSQRLRWLRLGQSRQRDYRVTITDPVPRTIIGANAYFNVGQQ